MFALLLLATSPQAVAHELPDRREAIVSLEADRVEVLLIHELPPGEDASLYRRMAEWDGRGTDGFLAQLVYQQWLLPRALDGLRVVRDNESIRWSIEDVSVREGAGASSSSRGLMLAVLLSGRLYPDAPLNHDPAGDSSDATPSLLRLSVVIARETPALRLIMQFDEGAWTLEDSPMERPTQAPVLGPMLLEPDGSATMLLRRRSAASDDEP